MLERLGLMALHRMDPERGHALALQALRAGLVGGHGGAVTSARLRTTLAGLDLPNPLGLAAGFDKNAVALAALGRVGFGFLEVGAVTPRAQDGNARPRLFRLAEDRATINRFGFNNQGMAIVASRLSARPAGVVVGLNLGANKDSADRAQDFVDVLTGCAPLVDFATVNVSSPNTERLRDLQGPEALRQLLARVMDARAALPRAIPVFVKIAPDLDPSELSDIAGVVVETRVSGIIATNTTLSREGLKSEWRDQPGGLAGRPLFEKSTRVLALLARATGGTVPLIGVGGIEDAASAYAKIKAGASAVQLYSALVYGGFSLVGRILTGLDSALERDGHERVADAVGTETGLWT